MREFSPEFFSKPDKEPSEEEDSSLMSKIGKNKMLRAGIAAVGIHGAVAGAREIREGVAYAAEAAKHWSEGYVIRPQSDELRKQVEAKVHQREVRKDEKGLIAYKQEMAQRLEHGEDVSFEESYFKQAELNGVSHEEVIKAERAVDGMVQHFASKLEGGLTDEEIRDISRSMFTAATYEWGSGNVVDYFVNHKRNCVSLDQGQEIVFERLIKLLPEEQRGRFHLGKRFERQHQIAMIAISQRSDLPPDRYIALQPPYDTERAGYAPAGTATVLDHQIKAALAGKRVVASAVKSKKGESEVMSGPNIDVIVDQPVDEGIIVEGLLRSAMANREQAERERVAPIPQAEYDKRYKRVMEIEIQTNDPNDQSPEEALRRIQKAKEIDPTAFPIVVDLKSFTKPNDWTVLAEIDGKNERRTKFEFGSTEQWGQISIKILSGLNANEISVALDRNGKLDPRFIKNVSSLVDEDALSNAPRTIRMRPYQIAWHTLELRQSVEGGSSGIDVVQLKELLTTLEHFRDIRYMHALDGRNNRRDLKIDADSLSDEALKAIKQHPPSALHITKRMKAIWGGGGTSSSKQWQERQEMARLQKGLESLGIPVFIEIENLDLGKGEPVPGGDYDWMLLNHNFIFPEFSSLRRLIEHGKGSPSFFNDVFMYRSSTNSATGFHDAQKSYLLAEFIDRLDQEYRSPAGIHTSEEWELIERFYQALMIGDGRLGSENQMLDHPYKKMSDLSEAELMQRENKNEDNFTNL